MSTILQPRTVRGGEYNPTVPRSGNQGDDIWLVENMMRRGQGDSAYWECYGGHQSMTGTYPFSDLAGTVSVAAGSTIVTGVGTKFLSELHIGQFVLVMVGGDTVPLFVKRIDNDLQYIAWRPATRAITGAVATRMCVLFNLNNKRAQLVWGNAIELDKGNWILVGNGNLVVRGADPAGGPFPADPHPSILLRDIGGSYTQHTLGMYPNGTPRPTANPVGGGVKTMLAGDYSIRITPSRPETGGSNNPSERADLIGLADGGMAELDLPPMDASRGQTGWDIYVTTYLASIDGGQNKFQGPWHYYVTITAADITAGGSNGGGLYTFEWLDAEVEANELLEFNNDPPPEAERVLLLGGIPVYFSCRGPSYHRTGPPVEDNIDPAPGPVIAPAKPNNIEAAPTEVEFTSSPPETIIGAIMGAEGRIYAMTENSLQIVQTTQRDDAPMLSRPYWLSGFCNPYQLVFTDGWLYGYTTGGPARSTADGDTQNAAKDWATRVQEITDLWTDGHVLMEYHPTKDLMCFFHSADSLAGGYWTTRVLLYSPSQQRWVGNIRLSNPAGDAIVCGVTRMGNNLQFTMGGRNAPLTTYMFDIADGTPVLYYWVPQLTDSGAETRDKRVGALSFRGKVKQGSIAVWGYSATQLVDAKVLAQANNWDLVEGNITKAIGIPQTEDVAYTKRLPTNCKGLATHTIKVEGIYNGTDIIRDRIDEVVYEQMVRGARR